MKEKCRNCARPSKACIAYLMTITTKETLEWCRMWKDRFGWSNAVVAEKSDVPIGTISRIFSHSKTEDEAAGVKLATIRPVICALTGCALEELESCEGQSDLLAAHADDRAKIEYLKEQIKFKEEQMRAKDHQLELKDAQLASKDEQLKDYANFTKRKNRILGWTMVAAIIPWLIIIAALVIDRLDSSKGFFWLELMNWSGDPANQLFHWML